MSRWSERYSRRIAMTEHRQAGEDLDTRLAEFDRKLRAIQAELAPPRAGAAAPEPQGAAAPEPQPELQAAAPEPQPRPEALTELHALLASLHGVLSDLESVLARISVEPRAAAPAETRAATIAAGPFTTIEQVREFERRLGAIGGVREVSVRGYEGAARAIIDVQLDEDH